MREVERIAEQLKRAVHGEAWHGPAVLELLKDVTAKQAATRPVSNAHSIWELSLHIVAWLRACQRRLAGEAAQVSTSEDFPKLTNNNEAAWQQVIDSIKQADQELRNDLVQVDDSRLDEPIVAGMSTVYVTLHGAIQHTLYHAGQIAVLKKALSEGQTT